MFKLEFEVRDNELDIQGVVNNANYSIYMAHARHKYATSIGLDFGKMAQNGQNLFLIESKIEFKYPLYANDIFYIETKLVPEGKIRFAFEQIIKNSQDKIVAKAYNICVCIDENNRRRPYIPEIIQQQLGKNESNV